MEREEKKSKKLKDDLQKPTKDDKSKSDPEAVQTKRSGTGINPDLHSSFEHTSLFINDENSDSDSN
jgi:hypothetical protein